jgi:flagellin-like protein
MIVPVIGLLILVAVIFYAWGVANGRDEERRLHGWGPR